MLCIFVGDGGVVSIAQFKAVGQRRVEVTYVWGHQAYSLVFALL